MCTAISDPPMYNPAVKLPCRCSIYMEGLEWFLYNRTPAYDAIVERMKATEESRATPTRDIKNQSEPRRPRRRWWGGRKSPPPEGHNEEKPVDHLNRPRPLSPPIPPSARLRERLRKSRRPEEQKAEWNWARDLLPLEIIVDTGAVVVGSDSTPTVTIAEFKNGIGTYEATEVGVVWRRREEFGRRANVGPSFNRAAANWICTSSWRGSTSRKSKCSCERIRTIQGYYWSMERGRTRSWSRTSESLRLTKSCAAS